MGRKRRIDLPLEARLRQDEPDVQVARARRRQGGTDSPPLRAQDGAADAHGVGPEREASCTP
eukprot:1385838-Alexandrium_andersonii.AAC.1